MTYMTTAILAAGFTVGLVAGWGLSLLFRGAGPRVGCLPVKAALVKHSPVGTLILDPDLNVSFANEAFCRFFSLAAGQVVGHRMQDIIETRLKSVVEQPEALESSLLSAYATGAPTSSLEIHVLSEGPREQLWLEHTSHEIPEGLLAGGRVAYFVDVTPPKSSAAGQEARAERQEEFDLALVKLSRELDIPIRVQGNLVGALVVSQHAPRSWTWEEEQFAASIGDRASLIAETSQGRTSTPSAPPTPGEGVDINPMDGYVHLDNDLQFTFLNPTVLQWLKDRDYDGSDLVGNQTPS